jgi:hypothetical protein
MRCSYPDLLGILKCTDADVHSLFRCGSRVYGCATEASDEDFLVVLTKPGAKQDLLFRPGINITIHTAQSFQEAMSRHSIFALECFFSPPGTRLKDGPAFPFRLNIGRLMVQAVDTSESDWNKAVKLWEDELDASQKKLYHSIRVLMFARQLIQHGRILDFGEANPVWAQVKESIEWEPFEPLRTNLLETLC